MVFKPFNNGFSSACIKGSQRLPKIALGLPKINARKSGTPNLRYLVICNKNLEWIYVLFSLTMAVLLHKWV